MNLSQPFRIYLNLFGPIQVNLNLSEPIQINLKLSNFQCLIKFLVYVEIANIFFSSTAAPSRCTPLRYRCGCFSKTGNFFLNANWQSFFKLQSPMNTRLNTSWGHPKCVLHLTHQNKGIGAIVVGLVAHRGLHHCLS